MKLSQPDKGLVDKMKKWPTGLDRKETYHFSKHNLAYHQTHDFVI